MPDPSDAPADQQAPTDAASAADPPQPPATPDTGLAEQPQPNLQAEVEKWKAMARQHEAERKKAGKQLEELQRQTMSDQEKAVADAKASGRLEAQQEFGARLVDAEIRAVAAGRLSADQLGVLLQGLNRGAFLKDDGTVDGESVERFVEGLAPKPSTEETKPSGFPDLGQGVRGQAPTASSNQLETQMKKLLGIST